MYLLEASPKAISLRTSYLQVWLDFYSSPQVIAQLFNVGAFGPPEGFTLPSTCPWVDHLVSRLRPATKRPIKTRFRYGCAAEQLILATNRNSPDHYAKGTLSSVTTEVAIGLQLLVSVWFQVLFIPLIGVLFIFRSRYFSLSVVKEYLALEGGPPCFTSSFTSSVLLWYAHITEVNNFRLRDFHPLWLNFPDQFC